MKQIKKIIIVKCTGLTPKKTAVQHVFVFSPAANSSLVFFFARTLSSIKEFYSLMSHSSWVNLYTEQRVYFKVKDR